MQHVDTDKNQSIYPRETIYSLYALIYYIEEIKYEIT